MAQLQGDPQLSQNAGQAQLQWQNRPQVTPQFQGLDDATAAAGQAANPNAAPNATSSNETLNVLEPDEMGAHTGAPAPQQASSHAGDGGFGVPGAPGGAPAPQQATTRLRDVGNGEAGYGQRMSRRPSYGGGNRSYGGYAGASPFQHWLAAVNRGGFGGQQQAQTQQAPAPQPAQTQQAPAAPASSGFAATGTTTDRNTPMVRGPSYTGPADRNNVLY